MKVVLCCVLSKVIVLVFASGAATRLGAFMLAERLGRLQIRRVYPISRNGGVVVYARQPRAVRVLKAIVASSWGAFYFYD